MCGEASSPCTDHAHSAAHDNAEAPLFSLPVMFAYEQCLLVLGHHPDVWYEAAQYLEQSSKLLAEKGVRG